MKRIFQIEGWGGTRRVRTICGLCGRRGPIARRRPDAIKLSRVKGWSWVHVYSARRGRVSVEVCPSCLTRLFQHQ